MPRNLLLDEAGFLGLEAGTSPERMPKGTLQVADNVFLDGPLPGSNAGLSSRPGAQGQLSATLSTRIWDNQVYKTTAGVQKVYFATGNGSNTAGQIVRWTKDATATTGLTALGTFAETAVRFTRLGNYLFIIGNTDGQLRRYSPDLEAVDYPVIATPTYRPAVTRVSLPLFDNGGTNSVFSQAGQFAADTIASGGFTITEADFANGSLTGRTTGQQLCTTPSPVTAWIVTAGTVECAASVDSFYPAKKYARLDEAGSGFKIDSTVILTNKAKTNTGGLGAGARKAVKFQLGFRMLSTSANDSILATILLYDSGGTQLAGGTLTQTFTNESVNASATLIKTYSFGSIFDDTLPIKVGIQFTAGDGNNPGSNGPYVTDVTLTAVEPVPAFTQNGSFVDVREYIAYQQDPAGVLIGQQRFTYDLSATMDYSTKSRIAAVYNPYYDFNDFRVKFAVRSGTAGTAYYTNDVQVVSDGSGSTYLAGDLSSIPAANRTAVRYIDLFFPQDFSLTSPGLNNGQNLFGIGALVEAGNLSVDAEKYDYRIVEKSTATQVLSGGGPISVSITPTPYQAAAQISLASQTPLPQDTSITAGPVLVVYRRGGTFPDGQFRKIGEFPPGTATTATYFTWDNTNKLFTDKTPDSVLNLNADGAIDFNFRDHQVPPTGCRAIAVYNSRLCLATDTELWVSQFSPVTNATGLYFNRFEDPSDPVPQELGFYDRITGGDGAAVGDAIQAMKPYRELLVIFFQNSIYQFGGNDSTDFFIRRFEGDEGKGLIAPYACAVLDNVLFYLAADGLRTFDLQRTRRISRPIDALISPKDTFSGAALLAAAAQKASVIGHADRVYLVLPLTSSDTQPNAIYVLDRRLPGRDIALSYSVGDYAGASPMHGEWTRWKMGEISNGFVLSSAGDTDDFYLTGPGPLSGQTAGQIFKVGNAQGDKLLPANAVTGVPVFVSGRGLGGGALELYAQRMSVALQSTDPITAQFAITASQGYENPTATTWQTNYSLGAGGGSARRLKVSDIARGRLLEWSVACTPTTAMVTLQRVAIEATTGRDL